MRGLDLTCVEACEAATKGCGAAGWGHIVGHQIVHGWQGDPLP